MSFRTWYSMSIIQKRLQKLFFIIVGFPDTPVLKSFHVFIIFEKMEALHVVLVASIPTSSRVSCDWKFPNTLTLVICPLYGVGLETPLSVSSWPTNQFPPSGRLFPVARSRMIINYDVLIFRYSLCLRLHRNLEFCLVPELWNTSSFACLQKWKNRLFMNAQESET